MPRVTTDLGAVPETLLWNLHHRALEARRPDSVIHDPEAVRLVGEIDFPFSATFGESSVLAQAQALRARTFDREIRRFLSASTPRAADALAHAPAPTVIALGEGLETQFSRVDDGRVRWVTVELPEVAALREQLLPPAPGRQQLIACDVLAPDWITEVTAGLGPGGGPVLLTAQGLLMYLAPDEVHALLARLAVAFPGAALLFDAIPGWYSRATVRGRVETTEGYRSPPMPWGLDGAERARLLADPGIAELRDVAPDRGRGALQAHVLPALARIPPVYRALPFPSPHVLRFTSASAGGTPSVQRFGP